jgi:hypothetical protein
MLKSRRGQNIAEYSILIAIVIGAAVAMQVYVKRGMQGRVKNAVDYKGLSGTEMVGDTGLQFTTSQYEPDYSESAANVTSHHNIGNQHVGVNGDTTHTGFDEEQRRLSGSTDVSTYSGSK